MRATLPDGVDPQVVAGSLDDLPITTVSVTGDGTTAQLAQRVRQSVLPPLEKLAGVRAATLTGDPGAAHHDHPKDALADRRLRDTVISETLQVSGVLVPAGTVTEDGTTRAIQVGTELGSIADIRALPLSGVTEQQWNASGGDLSRRRRSATSRRSRRRPTR